MGNGGGAVIMIAYIVIFGAFFYFFILRPQKKQQQQHDALMSELQPGDSVLTSSGFYGTVINISDDVVVVEFGNNKNCIIPMQKSAIVDVEKEEDGIVNEKK